MKQSENSELGSTKLLCDLTSLTSRIQMEAISKQAWDIKFVTQTIFCIRYCIQFLKPWFYLNICSDQHMHHGLVYIFLAALPL